MCPQGMGLSSQDRVHLRKCSGARVYLKAGHLGKWVRPWSGVCPLK